MKIRSLASGFAPRRLVAQQWSNNSARVARMYSSSELPGMDASKLTITKTTTPKELTPPEQLVFGNKFTDHMLSCEWTAKDGVFPMLKS